MQIILFLIFINYFTLFFQIGQIGGFGITLVDSSIVILYIYVTKKILWDGKSLKFSWHPSLWFLVLLIISVFISCIPSILEGNQVWIVQFIKSSNHFFFFAFFAVICSVYPIEIKTWSKVIRMWIIAALFVDIFGIYQIFARIYDLPLAWIAITNVNFTARYAEHPDEIQQLSLRYGDFYRATSIFSEPSALGAFNTYIFAFLIIPITNKFKHFVKSKVFLVVAIIACASSQLFTYSMTGFVGFLLILAGIVLFDKIKHLFRYTVILLVFCTVVVAADAVFSENMGISVVELFTKRIGGIIHWGDSEKEVHGETMGVRIVSGYKALSIWKEYPVTGIGIGLSQYNKINDLAFADFTFMGVLAELGLTGIIAFVGMFAALFFSTIRFIQQKSQLLAFDDEEKRNIVLMFYVMLVQFLINFISGNNLISIGMWVPISMVFSILNSVNVRMNRYIVEFSVVKKPLKFYFAEAFTTYLNNGMNNNTLRKSTLSFLRLPYWSRKGKNKS